MRTCQQRTGSELASGMTVRSSYCGRPTSGSAMCSAQCRRGVAASACYGRRAVMSLTSHMLMQGQGESTLRSRRASRLTLHGCRVARAGAARAPTQKQRVSTVARRTGSLGSDFIKKMGIFLHSTVVSTDYRVVCMYSTDMQLAGPGVSHATVCTPRARGYIQYPRTTPGRPETQRRKAKCKNQNQKTARRAPPRPGARLPGEPGVTGVLRLWSML